MLRVLLLLAAILVATVRAEAEEANPEFFGDVWAQERFDKQKHKAEDALKHQELVDALEARELTLTRELRAIEGELEELTVREKALARKHGAFAYVEQRDEILAMIKKRIDEAHKFDTRAAKLMATYERVAAKAKSIKDVPLVKVSAQLDTVVSTFRQFVKDAVHCSALRRLQPTYRTECFAARRRTKADPVQNAPESSQGWDVDRVVKHFQSMGANKATLDALRENKVNGELLERAHDEIVHSSDDSSALLTKWGVPSALVKKHASWVHARRRVSVYKFTSLKAKPAPKDDDELDGPDMKLYRDEPELVGRRMRTISADLF